MTQVASSPTPIVSNLYTTNTVASIASVAAAQWDALAHPAGSEFNPFVAHAFLLALEGSDSASAGTGWQPCHVTLRDAAGGLVGVAPCYRKSHSLGEYVFDQAWAEAFGRVGGRYYPKLQVCVPFVPATGPRLLAATAVRRAALLQAVRDHCLASGASSAHLTFVPAQHASEADAGWLARTDLQFHWHNPGYASFEQFLAELSHSKRKQIRRERASVAAAGVTIQWLSGAELREHHWDTFFAFYQDTGARKWGRPYLTRAFFSLLSAAMAEHVVLMLAYRDSQPIAGALNLRGSHALFGRHWGAIEHVPNLHFEACYYQALDYAIAHKLPRVEAGAQGPHKLARGYLPVATHSLHFLAHQGLAAAVAEYLHHERSQVAVEQAVLADRAPFRAVAAGHADEP